MLFSIKLTIYQFIMCVLLLYYALRIWVSGSKIMTEEKDEEF